MKYVMEGNPETGKIVTPHLIVAQSYDCNYRCVGCNAVGQDKSISPKNMIRIVDAWQIYALQQDDGKGIFHLKGGEPLMFEGFWNTIHHTAEKGLYLFVTTNGSLIKKGEAKKLHDIYQQTDGQIIVSLDGSKEEINTLSRPQGSYDHARNAIETLVKNEVPVAWNYRVHRGNQNNIGNAIELAKDLGVIQFNVLYHTQIRNRHGNLELPDLDVVLEQLEKARNNGARDMLDWSVVDMVQNLGSGEYECNGCTAGFKGFAYITLDGNVYSCPNTVIKEHKLGTIEDSFEQMFSNENARNLRDIHRGRLVCKGELEAYKAQAQSMKNLVGSEELIKNKIADVKTTSNKKEKIAICFNRNW